MELFEILDIFLNEIDELYNTILQPIDNVYKIISIKNYKRKMNIEENQYFSAVYYEFMRKNKEKGVVYTPLEIGNYMILNTIKVEDIIKNPFIKILDPACGCGNILISCYKYLFKLYRENLDIINKNNNIKLKEESISIHIIKNNLFGFDIDKNALKILSIDLFSESNCLYNDNFVERDFLTEDIKNKFNVIISNPPYVGQKAVDREYSLKLKKLYSEIYKDKGDISYCFFQKAILNLKKSGKISFITSRYFLESPSGEELRKIFKELCSIEKIVDFYGIRPFKQVGIDPVIIFLVNSQNIKKDIEIIKPAGNIKENKTLFYNSLFLNEGEYYKKFYIKKNILNNKGWILRDETERNIINKIEKNSFTNLANICNSYQGIITGCDKAFVVDEEIIETEGIERNILEPWIKSSFIKKGSIDSTCKYIIYADNIDKEENYPNAVKHIETYKDKLLNRRECKNGIRKWYHLQWGRNKDIFNGEKIIFPYKSENNRFALDRGSFFSADVYALKLKENMPFTYEYLLFVLNSKIYEFYFKTFGKKLGENLYEYYPNNLMKLCIPTMTNNLDDNYLYDVFQLTEEEINIIKKQIL
ncbi:Eco57I restriction-modification methylase domain-containing protein [Clostridium pasteurianum]|uniref:site-specific DNA-methyltransferase (adenine-specific) n=1 Tax=Clostridium pasteurianum BC1 TaxID=86416 RepID=R4KBD4_CLOPA|nr:N-6 DNA methylase [Clostridium pasteurianum]AGK97849.1 type I restriction-modification system methyltransferase subunit [Clostridium pasteurianum BC1]